MKPAAVFPLAEFLRDELAARKWTTADLGRNTWLGPERLAAILAGDWVSLREAEALASVLGVSAMLLLNLQMAYKKYGSPPPDNKESNFDWRIT